ncbi:hypothetical protein [Phyllobacterium meliloti]|uniref:hypothetical protein n=1 Tax=Phyllobacterium meliloti TaxID=555317 RepID=UPI001D1524DA|nr:hypothetical protein [Phyllobacterium sp. T1293]UGX89092.1 hypothetical protein LLE53_023720 [Phyllobacterium sp. T1293]
MVTNLSILHFHAGTTPRGPWNGLPKRRSRPASRRPEPRRSWLKDQVLRWVCWLLVIIGQGLFWVAVRLYRWGLINRKHSWRLIQWSSSCNHAAIRILRRARW